MRLRMKNFNTMGFHEKPMYRGELPRKRAWTVWRFKGGCGGDGGQQKRGDGVFEEGLIPQCTLS